MSVSKIRCSNARLLALGHRERALEFGVDVLGGGAAGGQEGRAQASDLGLPGLRAAAHAPPLITERLAGQREAGLRLVGQGVALQQQAGGDTGQAGRRMGTLGLPEPVLRDLAAKAGFAQVRHVEMDNPFNSLYELTR